MLHRNSSDFVIMKDPSDPQDYEMVVLNCYLYIKVAKLSDTIYKEFYSRFLSGKETQNYEQNVSNVTWTCDDGRNV